MSGIVEFKLNKQVSSIVLKALEKGLTAASIEIQGDAKDESPVLSGAMRSNILYEVANNEAIVYDTMDYSPYVEFGTAKMDAQPFMRRALFKNKIKAAVIVSNVLRNEL